jgi:predicted nucleic acid-binding protein
MIAFIDTMVLIWWVRRQSTQGQENMIQRAHWLMEDLEQQCANVMVSSISVAEFLRGSTAAQQAEQMAIIEEVFLPAPFDQRAALTLAARSPAARGIKEYVDRTVAFKADQMIVASAAANKVNILYSHDVGMRKLATAFGIEARDLPEMPSSLFPK